MVIVSGPVDVDYPPQAEVVPVVSTEEMLAAARAAFADCDGLIGAAAPCDYRPERVESHKIAKTGEPLMLRLVETDDVVATLGCEKGRRWVVGFALETEDHRLRALAKLERKCCDLMVSNSVEAISSLENSVEILDPAGQVLRTAAGSKLAVAREILAVIDERLMTRALRSTKPARWAANPAPCPGVSSIRPRCACRVVATAAGVSILSGLAGNDPSALGNPLMVRIAVLGAAGYSAKELLRLLLAHPHAQLTALTTRQDERPHVGDVHPSLRGRLDLRLENLTPVEVAKRAECVFSCLPHAASAEAVKELLAAGGASRGLQRRLSIERCRRL